MARKAKTVTGAIVGLGHIGFGFNFDRKRSGVWTHEQAFARSRRVTLIGAVDMDPAQRRRFRAARPRVPVYPSLSELLLRGVPDLVSVCTPTRTHAAIARRCALAGVKAIFCEKPIAGSVPEALSLVALCKRKGVALAVNHTRRWDPRFRRAAALVRRGAIGAVRSASVRYSGHIFNIGTHLIDAVRMISGLDPLEAVGFSTDPAAEDPHVSGLLKLQGGVTCELSCHGRREDLLFELDFAGTEGRLRLSENGRKTELWRFKTSPRAAGYREPRPEPLPALEGPDRFVEAVKDLCGAMKGSRKGVACTGEDGARALAAACALRDSARGGSKPRKVRGGS